MSKWNLGDVFKMPAQAEEKPVSELDTSEYINVEPGFLSRNPLNFYNISEDDQFKDLVDDIREHGILHPLVVCPTSEDADTYRIISGHRRYQAAVKAGCATVPCRVVHPKSETEELLMLIKTNSTTRVLTPWETGEQVRQLTELVTKGRKDGSIEVPAGVKTREVVAQATGISQTEQARLKVISEKLVMPGLMEMYKTGKISKDTAYAIASRFDRDTQYKFFDWVIETHVIQVQTKTLDDFIRAQNEPTEEQIRMVVLKGTPLKIREYIQGHGLDAQKPMELHGIVRIAYDDEWRKAGFYDIYNQDLTDGVTYNFGHVQGGMMIDVYDGHSNKHKWVKWYELAGIVLDLRSRGKLLNDDEYNAYCQRLQDEAVAKMEENARKLKEEQEQVNAQMEEALKPEPETNGQFDRTYDIKQSYLLQFFDTHDVKPDEGTLCLLLNGDRLYLPDCGIYVDGDWYDMDDETKYRTCAERHLWCPIPYPPGWDLMKAMDFVDRVKRHKAIEEGVQ